MRVAELSATTGVSIASIKYYIREGLLPSGTRTAANQATYDHRHIERLGLIRALREVAGLPVATIRDTLAVVDDPGSGTPGSHVGTALAALSDPLDVPPEQRDRYASAATTVDGALRRLGWDIDEHAPARADLVRAVVAIDREFPGGVGADALVGYGRVAQDLAAAELPDDWDPAGAPADALRYAVLGTVLFEPVILALRRLAHAHRHAQLTDGRRS